MNIQSGLSRDANNNTFFMNFLMNILQSPASIFYLRDFFVRKEENLYIHKYILSNLRLIGKLPDETKKRRCGFSNNRKTIKIY